MSTTSRRFPVAGSFFHLVGPIAKMGIDMPLEEIQWFNEMAVSVDGLHAMSLSMELIKV
ncbi:MAG TPA: hypothetical protein VNE82_18560 [Candidatus Binataceae bacterium]|nr:hypothetical protein [Candidatus Binataceae bacterium]